MTPLFRLSTLDVVSRILLPENLPKPPQAIDNGYTVDIDLALNGQQYLGGGLNDDDANLFFELAIDGMPESTDWAAVDSSSVQQRLKDAIATVLDLDAKGQTLRLYDIQIPE